MNKIVAQYPYCYAVLAGMTLVHLFHFCSEYIRHANMFPNNICIVPNAPENTKTVPQK